MKIYFVIADRTPVLAFASRFSAEQLCVRRPDLHVAEFEIPTDLGPDNVKANLRELYKFKQTLAGLPPDIPKDQGFENMINGRQTIHRESLVGLHKQTARAAENPDIPSSALVRMVEGACQQPQCPGMMAYAMLSLT